MGLTKRVSKTRKTSMTFIQSIKYADSDATLFALIVILLMYRVISAIWTCRKLTHSLTWSPEGGQPLALSTASYQPDLPETVQL